MYRNIIVFLLALLTCIGCNDGKCRELRVLQLNIWCDATVVPGAFEALVDEIARLDVHIVALCEVNNRDGVTSERLVEALKRRGQTWHGASGRCNGIQGTDVCVLSKYPIEEITTGLSTVMGGVDMKVRIDVEGYDVLLYPAHLDYTHYACYLPRGYDGITWQRLSDSETEPATVLKMNRESTRDEAIAVFLEEVSCEQADLILLAGDFNEPSHLDWNEATREKWDHNGCVVPWDCSMQLYEAGFRDAYRVIHPDPTMYPGFTYPSDNPEKEIKDLTWAPEADERERIDFVYYMSDGAFAPKDAVLVGPSSSIVRNERVQDAGNDTFIEPLGVWPTDHKGVLVTFKSVRKN